MKKSILLNISLLLTGIFLGGMAVWFFKGNDKVKEIKVPIQKIKVVESIKTDTFVVREKVYIPVEKSSDTLLDYSQDLDSLNIFVNTDTLDVVEEVSSEIDTNIINDEISIIKEHLITTKSVTVVLHESDSLTIEEAFDLQQLNFADKILLEFWESPLELTGYELSRNKLKLFGFDPSENVVLSHSVDSDILEVQIGSLSLRLKKTDRFKTLYL